MIEGDQLTQDVGSNSTVFRVNAGPYGVRQVKHGWCVWNCGIGRRHDTSTYRTSTLAAERALLLNRVVASIAQPVSDQTAVDAAAEAALRGEEVDR
mgnify:CR=1 FL=1